MNKACAGYFVGILAVTAAVFAGPGVGHADQFLPARGGWQTYVNDRFGMSLDYPAAIFEPQAAPENGDGRTFTAGDALLQTFAFHNIENETPRSLKANLVGSDGYEDVTYSPSGRTWLVISGFRDDTIFYEKYFFSGGVISAFGMEFPADEKPYYSPMIERIEDSFKAGRSD